ncbi:MAG TPA: 3-hydroxyacyl-CoA dehydrogenase NAD-binding domain-containing protein [Opitutaceae bacterium]|nr:3-hydroxyacyl-CoA dehydrogenase NAD-binding domain-containing protein [Opitutaceae bacterium]
MNITRSLSADGVCVLTFDRAGSTANVFDRATLEELNSHLAAIESDASVRGVLVTSAKSKIFIAGADLNAFSKSSDERALGEMVDLGHNIFGRLARLSVPSVAAIHGVCLGGGFELALACDWRVASTDKATKLGLPETQLGILPAWGGSTRLPRLIGLPAALGLILTGKQLVGAQALKAGVVDELAHPEYLLEAAQKFLARGKRRAKPLAWTSRAPLSSFVASQARRNVLKKTRGHYPAPLKAIDVCTRAVSGSLEDGLAAERAAFLELVRTPECRSLMSVFFLQERAKKLVAPGAEGCARAVKKVAVIGAGTMGAGIAQWVSARGFPVRLKDVNPEALSRGMHAIEKVYADAVKRRVFTLPEATAGLDRVTPIHTDIPLTDIDLVIEAALEKLDLKQLLFRDLEVRVGPNAVLATNTSALSIDQIASVLARPERVVGMHFFNPVHRMQLVEIVRGPRTSSQAVDTALQFVKALGKLPVIANDSPGFLVNRILLPYMVEAVWLFSEGIPAEEIDRAMLNFGMPMGPMRLCDEVGLDVAQHVAKDLERRLPQPVPINDTLEKMVARGWLGKKNGKGFYLHGGKGKGERSEPNAETRSLQPEKARASDVATQVDRMVLIMVNEAARVLAEGVVDTPEDVDFGMIMGTGWAPFRGGPCRYADTRGIAEIVQRLEQLARDVAPHFLPCQRLREMARDGRLFYSKSTAAAPAAKAKAAAAAPQLVVTAPTPSEVARVALTDRPLVTPTRETAATE